jgi:hypothetical protein
MHDGAQGLSLSEKYEDDLSLMLADFYVSALTPRLNSSEISQQLPKAQSSLRSVAHTGVISKGI